MQELQELADKSLEAKLLKPRHIKTTRLKENNKPFSTKNMEFVVEFTEEDSISICDT